jgi:hypothetical protein
MGTTDSRETRDLKRIFALSFERVLVSFARPQGRRRGNYKLSEYGEVIRGSQYCLA